MLPTASSVGLGASSQQPSSVLHSASIALCLEDLAPAARVFDELTMLILDAQV
jgi:hypothetical protein